ncbi:MAG: hypothetical protein U1A24_10075 [Cypionkella sp.]|uniref:hypothetical protein n=1 Tax=Cypionkella sp. TaxID=2811411 RepID=UPI002AB996AF|nr:hypothetical protein [Cypionkella sp.]MDZ4310884.1 hypothetical protein [Cypionkella sp.]
MNVTSPILAEPVTKQIRVADVMAPPLAPLAMPKQVLTLPQGGLLRAVRSWIWAVAPGLRRLG